MLSCRLSASRLSAIHRPEQQQDELSAIPAPKLAYRHQTSLSSASLTNGGIGTAYTIKASPPQMQPGNFLASQVLDHTQRLHSAGVAPASGLSTAQLEVLAEDSLGASSPIWNAAARNQAASSILPANELDALLKQPLDVIYTKYIYFLSQGAFEPALRLLSLCIQSKRQDMVNR